MLLQYAAITHPGKVRKNNEDAYLLSALDGEEPFISELAQSLMVGDHGLLVAVADGMGGAAAGEVASRESLAAVSLFLFRHWGRLALILGFVALLTGASALVFRQKTLRLTYALD